MQVTEPDIVEMQQRVAGARRVLAASRDAARAQRRSRAGLLAAAAVVIALGVSLVAPDFRLPAPSERLVAVAAAVVDDPGVLEEARREAAKHLAMLPLVEGVGQISQQVQGTTFDWIELRFEP